MIDIADTLVHLCMAIGIVGNAVSMIFMLKIWRSYDVSLELLQQQVFELCVREIGRKYGTGIPSMAEDTEVAE